MKTKQTSTTPLRSIDSAQLDAVLGGCACGCDQAACNCTNGSCRQGIVASSRRLGWAHRA